MISFRVSFALVLLGTLVWPTVALAQTASPSFNCRNARTADEYAICHDTRLAELDQAVSIAYSLVTHRQGSDGEYFKEEVQKSAREALEARHACGADRLCILDQQVNAIVNFSGDSGTHVPPWVGSYRLRLFAKRSESLSDGLPLRVGQCTNTKS